MKRIITITIFISLYSLIGHAQIKVDFGDLKDGMVLPRGKIGTTQNDTLGTVLFDTTDLSLYLDNGVEFRRIPYSTTVEELNSADLKSTVTIENRLFALDIEGKPTFTVDTSGRISLPDFNSSTFVGYQSGKNKVDGEFNTFYGFNSGLGFRKGEGNTFLGYSSGYFADSTMFNTYVGSNTGAQGHHNTYVGYGVAPNKVRGRGNVGLGANVLTSDSIGDFNVGIGFQSLNQSRSGDKNISIGDNTLSNLKNGSDNIAIGSGALYEIKSGYGNVVIGSRAGEKNKGNENVFIGNQAGLLEVGSNKLYIEPSASTQPLIYGDFNNDELTIHGNLSVNTTSHKGALHIKQKTDPVAVVPGNNINTLSGITIERSNGDTTWHIAIDDLNGLNFGIGRTLKAYVDPASGKWITATGASPLTHIPTKSKTNMKQLMQKLKVDEWIPKNNPKSRVLRVDLDDLKVHYPQAVSSHGRLEGVDYDHISILNLSVIQELITENNELKRRMKSYEDRLGQLERISVQKADSQ